MKFVLKALAACSLFAVAVPASAQVALEANVAKAEDQWGGEIGAGYSVVSLGGFQITPGAGVFLYKGDNDRYVMDDNGGNPRCRDLANGQYADSSNCNDLAAKVYGRLEATYTIPASVTLGAGVRYMSEEFRPYGTLAVPLGPLLHVKANVGSEYYAAGVLARF